MPKLALAGLKDEARAARYRARGLARRYGIGIRQFERLFRQYTGTSPQHWLNWLRLQDAAPLLNRGKSVKEVAQELGFRQASHFSRQFKQHYGISPKQAQQTHGKGSVSSPDTKLSSADMPSLCSIAGTGCAMGMQGPDGFPVGYVSAVSGTKSSELIVWGRSWSLVGEAMRESNPPPAG